MRHTPKARWHLAEAMIGLAFAVLAQPVSAQSAQTYTLSLNTQTVTIPAPTATDYTNGYSAITQSITYTLSAVHVSGSHTVQIQIKSASATLGGGKAIADLQWQLNGTSTWTSMTTSDVLVQSHVISATNPLFTGLIRFRVLLRWASDPPASYTATVNIDLIV